MVLDGRKRGPHEDPEARLAGASSSRSSAATTPTTSSTSTRTSSRRRDPPERDARGLTIVVGAAADPMQIPPFTLIPGSPGVDRHASGTSKDSEDSEDTLRFSALLGTGPTIETYPLRRAPEGYAPG